MLKSVIFFSFFYLPLKTFKTASQTNLY